MSYLISLIILVGIFYLLWKHSWFSLAGIPQKWIWIAFGFKLIMAIVLIVYYSKDSQTIENADIFRFYQDAEKLSSFATESPKEYLNTLMGINQLSEIQLVQLNMNNWAISEDSMLQPNSRFFIGLLSVLQIITFKSYYAIALLFLFASWIGMLSIFKFLQRKVELNKPFPLFVLLFFFPSIAFWTSGILKETVLVFGIGTVLYHLDLAFKPSKIFLRIPLILLAFYLIFAVKAFIAVALLVAVTAYLWNHFLPKQRQIIPYFMLFFVAFSLASESDKYLNKGVFDMLIEKQEAIIQQAQQQNAGSLINPIYYEPNAISVASNAPIAAVNVLFRPALWEAKGFDMKIAAIENLGIFVMLLLVVIFPAQKTQNKNLIWFSLAFAFSVLVIIGLTTPVTGASIRYRVPALIFILFAIYQFIDFETLKNHFSKIIKGKYSK